VFAGLRDDPFVTDPPSSTGSSARRAGVQADDVAHSGALDGRPVVAGPAVRGAVSIPSRFNVSALVSRFEKRGSGQSKSSGHVSREQHDDRLLGTTSRQKSFHRNDDDDNRGSAPFVQIQRMGQTLVKTSSFPSRNETGTTRVSRTRPGRPEQPEQVLASPGAPGFSRFIPDALTTSGTPGDPATRSPRERTS